MSTLPIEDIGFNIYEDVIIFERTFIGIFLCGGGLFFGKMNFESKWLKIGVNVCVTLFSIEVLGLFW